ncbi:MAG: GNAT family N-acetyltransferase [Candidatus Thorarchaeota archaeon]
MFEGTLVKLVPIGLRHLDDVYEAWNDPEMKQFLRGAIPDAYESEEKWIRRAIDEMAARRSFIFAIESLEDGRFLGTVGIHGIDWVARSATLGIAIHKRDDWTRGYGRDALRTIIGFAWKDLNLRRLELGVHAFNKRAIHVYESLGFKRYGTAHQVVFIRGKYADSHFMELFRDDWEARDDAD